MYGAGCMGILYLQASPAVVCQSKTANLKGTLAALAVSVEDYWNTRAAGSNTKKMLICMQEEGLAQGLPESPIKTSHRKETVVLLSEKGPWTIIWIVNECVRHLWQK